MLWTGVEEFATDLGTDVSGSLAGNGLNLSQSPQASLPFVAVVHAQLAKRLPSLFVSAVNVVFCLCARSLNVTVKDWEKLGMSMERTKPRELLLKASSCWWTWA